MEWGARLLGTGVPLRFVYAVKDSLFEKLGDDTKELASAGDVTSAETLRANRTKFFDVVIPDRAVHLAPQRARQTTGPSRAGRHPRIERRLQSMVAKHATDMRLLRNICNEYLVFAERLLVSDKVAPGLHPASCSLSWRTRTSSRRFRADRPWGQRALDRLYDIKTERVRLELSARRAEIRRLLALPASEQQIEVAAALGTKLVEIARTARAAATGGAHHTSPFDFTVGGTDYTENQTASWDFWAAVVSHGGLSFAAHHRVTLTRATLVGLLPEFDHPTMWREVDEAARRRDVAAIEAAIEEFRGADFQALVSLTASHQTSPDQPGTGAKSAQDKTTGSSEGAPPVMDKAFAEHIDETLASDLGARPRQRPVHRPELRPVRRRLLRHVRRRRRRKTSWCTTSSRT